MLRYLARRLLVLALTMVAASIVIFLLMSVVPGDPAQFMMGMNADPAALAALRAELGLDRPLPVRYLEWVGGLMIGDFGQSYTYRVPVSQLILDRIGLSLPLAFLALLLSIVIAIPAALFAAQRHNRAGDISVMGLSQIYKAFG